MKGWVRGLIVGVAVGVVGKVVVAGIDAGRCEVEAEKLSDKP